MMSFLHYRHLFVRRQFDMLARTSSLDDRTATADSHQKLLISLEELRMSAATRKCKQPINLNGFEAVPSNQ